MGMQLQPVAGQQAVGVKGACLLISGPADKAVQHMEAESLEDLQGSGGGGREG